MSKVARCPQCGGHIVEPAFEGDGDYPVAPMCVCPATQQRTSRRSGEGAA